MLPQSLSDRVFSLLPGRTVQSLTFAMRLDDEGALAEARFVPSVVDRVVKLSYEHADDAIARQRRSPDPAAAEHSLMLVDDLLAKRRSWRLKRVS